jgi:hypothetical protein
MIERGWETVLQERRGGGGKIGVAVLGWSYLFNQLEPNEKKVIGVF